MFRLESLLGATNIQQLSIYKIILRKKYDLDASFELLIKDN
jgi:hypothetical protein